jgi:hypothetical protein
VELITISPSAALTCSAANIHSCLKQHQARLISALTNITGCFLLCLQLVEALNEDYSDYVGLSGQLSGLEGAVVRMRQPLLEIQVG